MPKAHARMIAATTLVVIPLLGILGQPVAAQVAPGISADPSQAPSAAGERLILQLQGLVPPPPPAVPRPAPAVSAPAVAGADVRVNDGMDTPENTTQSETTLAVRGSTICAGFNDSGAGGFSGFSRSTNLGMTWTDGGGIGQSGDPVIAVHRASGTFYYAEIATVGGNPAIGVASSTNDCQTFAAAVDASPGASASPATTLNDKPWIAVDNSGGPNDGNIYACWTRFFSGTSELRVSRSTDGGATFVNEQIIAPSGTAPFGCSVAVGPGSQVYVVWADRTGATMDDIRFSMSTDGGQNYSAPVSIATGNRHPGIDTVVTCPTGTNPSATRPTLTGNIRMLHQAWLAVDTTGGPFNGNLYVVYATDPTGTPDNSDVFFVRSTNGGTMWSAPVQLGAGGGATDQFEPFAAVGGLGTVSIAWYDRRNDPANNTLIDVYKTFSRDGGGTFDPIVRVTDVSFGVPLINPNFDPNVVNCYMGEYIAIAGDQTGFYYLWGDNRNTLVTTNFPGGRLDPDVFFESEPVPGVAIDLSITKDDGQTTAVPGLPVTYTIVATNLGAVAVNGATVSDSFPAALTGVTWTCTASVGSSCTASGSANISDNVNLLAGGTATYTVTGTVDPAATGTLDNTATVAVPSGFTDSNSSNNSATDSDQLIPEADLAVTKNATPDVVFAGGIIKFDVTVVNNGPSSAANATLTDTVPANTTFLYVTPPVGWMCMTPPVGGTGTITCSTATFPVSVPADFVIGVVVDSSTPTGTIISNTVTASSDATDPNPGNNTPPATSTPAVMLVPALSGVGILASILVLLATAAAAFRRRRFHRS